MAVETITLWVEDYPVRFYHIKKKRTLCPSLLCDFMQDAAINHFEAMGFDPEKMLQQNQAWFLSRIRMTLRRLPERKEKIRINTWQPGLSRVFALRDFILLDQGGDEIGRAVTSWVAVDCKNQRIIRPELILDNDVFGDSQRALNSDAPKLRAVTNPRHICDFKVHENNVDYNGHTNSIVYLKWVMKIITEILGSEYSPVEIEVNYNNQSYLHDTVVLWSELKPGPDANTLTSCHSLVHKANHKNLCNIRILHQYS